ncbi:MAG: ABC transporter ATP-binding protein [Anaerolineae bacterium]|nr:ABC transporter ATP-binding protein [Anaerolineae bacterium]
MEQFIVSQLEPVLEVRGITKRFPGVLANDRIDMTLYKGRVLGLLGENGAGKSTLMNLIYGLYAPDEGEILVNGVAVEITGPEDAIAKGIGMVHQHFQLVDVLTVTENVMLGNESVKGLLLDRQSARQRIIEISEQYGLDVNPDAVIRDIPVGIQQRVEIIKALYRDADILILDEPTAVLTPQETQGLFQIMRTLLDKGVSIIFISHKLKEVLEICDDITVLRRGKLAGHADPKQSTEQSLASLMVGRDVVLQIDKERGQQQELVMQIDNLRVHDGRGIPAVEDVSLSIYAGEILGIAGVQGNGQSELIEAISGLRHVDSGHVMLLGQDITNASPRQITEVGSAHVPEDRQRMGMVMPFEVMFNMVLNSYHNEPFSNGILVNEDAIAEHAQELVEAYDVRPPYIHATIGELSGGNQQKVIIAREFSRPVKLLIAAQPTRGLDVGSIEFIHKQIVRMRDEGTAVLLISSELDEILSLSDRVAVMFDGQVIDILPIEDADRDTVGLRMAGSMDMANNNGGAA